MYYAIMILGGGRTVPLLLQTEPGIDVAAGSPEGAGLGALVGPALGVIAVVVLGAGIFFALRWFRQKSASAPRPRRSTGTS